MSYIGLSSKEAGMRAGRRVADHLMRESVSEHENIASVVRSDRDHVCSVVYDDDGV